ncbi:MAG: thiamine pyrophosphate-binding protein [Chloroflexi bacterium]|nr:thiamine pyrophosphate-binding protein [Chloroflexota bacterium]MDA1298231.1 thiamine pyrophosphate-binding protein [Chloroflexota bacterium]
MPKMTGAKFLAETMHGYGVTHFFFMPVVVPQAMPEMERLGIRRIMAHSEKSAAYMADAYGRVSRSPAVCGSQSVGAANLAAGLQDAYLGCSPVIALTGRLPQIQQHRNAYQEIDHHSPFDAVTKFNTRVNTIEELPVFLRQAFRESVTGTPGPSHLDLSGIAGGDIMLAETDLEVVVEEPFTRVPPFRPEPDTASVNLAISLLRKAERPVIVAGGGVTASGAGKELVRFAELMQVPVATSLNAKETFPAGHPMAVGTPGSYSRDCANRAVAGADLVFFIGSHTGGQVTNEWRVPKLGTPVIQLDINAAELGRSYPISAGLHGDVAASLRKMTAAAGSAEPSQAQARWLTTVQRYVSEWRAGVSEHYNSDALPMRPERLCKELTEILPDDSILVSDTGHAGIWTGTMIDFKDPGQSFIRCAGSLGWGLPAAIGAKCAAPERPVVCFTGDGGVWYHMSEIETAVRYGINSVTVVNNNASLNQEQGLNEDIYRGRTPGSDELWMLTDGDFAAMAESMGALGIQVTRPGDMASAMDQAINAKRPVVIDVKTDIEGIAPKAWLPK